MKMLKLAAAGAALFAAGSVAHAGATFDNVKKKGFVQCGVSTGIPGFSIADSKGEWKGWTWTCAAPSPPPCSAMRRSSRSRRSIRNNASPRCSPARSTC